MTVLPTLAPDVVLQSTMLVLRATTLISEASDPAEQQQRQEELERVVNSPDAWGLITPFLEYDSDPNVQFYGAHILGVKIARAWNTLDTSIHFPLRDSILELTGRAIALQRPKMVLRRLYIAITAIALKLTTASPPQWSDFLTSSLLALQSQGANKEALLEFMTIAVEEVHRAPKGSKYSSYISINLHKTECRHFDIIAITLQMLSTQRFLPSWTPLLAPSFLLRAKRRRTC
ncbi:hypothetical protein FRC14_003524 [Serendipita sp. 396]|nr:hypothetical protein FRC14_003524 [Serendipita sp. 396]KAG9034365.1 hypothetical protein FS842_003816 [Serendipita sp. 407]